MLVPSDMRHALVALVLVGCVDEREPQTVEPLISFASLGCEVTGAQVVIEGTWDVRLAPGATFRVDHVTTLGKATANAFAFYGCNGWKLMHDGCVRQGDQPETNPVSLRVTDNITSGTLPTSVRVEVTGVVESDDVAIETSRTIDCVY